MFFFPLCVIMYTNIWGCVGLCTCICISVNMSISMCVCSHPCVGVYLYTCFLCMSYIDVYARVYRNADVYGYLYTSIRILRQCMFVIVSSCVRICTRVSVSGKQYAYESVYLCTCLLLFVCMCTSLCVSVYQQTYVFVYMCARLFLCEWVSV